MDSIEVARNDIIIQIYNAMVDGATEGLCDDQLFTYVKRRIPTANSGRLVEASVIALLDRHLTDVSILRVIYALAIKHRLNPVNEQEFANLLQSNFSRQSMGLDQTNPDASASKG